MPDMEGADPLAAGLLIECRGQTPEDKDVSACAMSQSPDSSCLPLGVCLDSG